LSPEDIQKKTKLNKYDKEIMAQSKRWSKDETLRFLKSLGQWQILCKQRSPIVYNEMKLKLIVSN
jgi:hypothetical protein